MASFEDLGVVPELVEALAAEGIEIPSSFQESALPVLFRENSLMAQAGPGAGTLVAYGLPILQAVDPEATSPQALVLTATSEGALRLAQSLSRLSQVTGHRVTALGTPWALAQKAAVLFTTPENLLKEVRSSSVSLAGARFVVVEAFNALLPPAREALETLFEILPREGQRVILGQPLSPEAEAFGKAHMTRAVHIPPKAVERGDHGNETSRGQIHYRITGDNRELELLQVVSAALEGGIHHVLVFTRSEDQAADTGDFLGIHGFLAGEPGDKELPVWLGVNELPARRVVEEWDAGAPILVLSLDVPADADSLDRRHGVGEEGLILVRSREFLHLREIARRAGYRLLPAKEPLPTRVGTELERLTALLERTLQEENLAPHFLALESVFQDHSPGEVAAAALWLLQRKGVAAGAKEAQTSATAADDKGAGPAPKTWVRLFVGVGEKEEIGPGDLLGAIAGEAGVDGSQVGKIEIRETFSLVEVVSTVAERVVRGLNGTTIRGRSVRVDYDRGGPAGRGSPGGRGGRPPGRGGSPGGRSGGREGSRRRLKGDGPRES